MCVNCARANQQSIRSPEANIPLLRKALEWAEAEATKEDGVWNQNAWFQVNGIEASWIYDDVMSEHLVVDPFSCDSSFCLAGNICALQGDKFLVDEGIGVAFYVVRSDNARREPVSVRAAELLGITREAAEALFDESNSIEDLREIAELIAGEAL